MEYNNPSDFSQIKVQIIVVATIMAVCFSLAARLWGQIKLDQNSDISFGYYFKHALEYSPFLLMVVFASLTVLTYYSRVPDPDKKQPPNQNKNDGLIQKNESAKTFVRNLIVAFITSLPAMLVFYSLLSAILLLLHEWKNLGDEGYWLAFVWTPPLILGVLALALVMLLGMLGNNTYEVVREWWSRCAAWFVIYGFAWIVIVVVAVYGPMWSEILHYHGSWEALGTGWIGATLAGLFAGKSASTNGTDSKGINAKLKQVIAIVAPFVFIAGLLIAVSMILHLSIANTTDFSRLNLLGDTEQPSEALKLQIDPNSEVHIDVSATQGKNLKPLLEQNKISKYPRHWNLLYNQDFSKVSGLFAACLGVFFLLGWRVDINQFSLSAFYRSRLVRCYLGATRDKRHPHLFTGFDEKDDLPLSELDGFDKNNRFNGPLHIINCTLNLAHI